MESEKKLYGTLQIQESFSWIGPLSLFFSLSLALLKGATFSFGLFSLTLIGFLASIFFATRGAMATALLLLGYYFIHKSHLPPGTHLWHFGLFLSLALAFVITSLGLESEAKVEKEEESVSPQQTALQHLQNTLKLKEEKIGKLEDLLKESDLQVQDLFNESEALKEESKYHRRQIELLKQEIEEGQNEGSSHAKLYELSQLNSALQKMIAERDLSLKQVTEELNLTQHEMKILTSRQRALFSNEITRETFKQLQDEREALQKAYEELSEECERIKEKMADAPPDLKSLRTQFEEKKEILHQTRAELFRSESDLLTYEKLLSEKEIEPTPAEQLLTDILNQSHEECIALEEENHLLGQMISQLVQNNDSP